MQEQRDRCPSCRTPWAEATADDLQGHWEAVQHRCNPCEVRDAMERNTAEMYPDRRLPAGLMFSVVRRPPGRGVSRTS